MQDVIVVGAGPAGSTAAEYTAKAGLSTMIIEKDSLPRDKTCAGGISSQALKHLDHDVPVNLVKRQCFGARVLYENQVLESRSDELIASMVSRKEFDNYLTTKAVNSGTKLLQKTRVKSLDIKSNHVEIHTTAGVFKSKVVIGADGVNSVCARYVRAQLKPDETAFSLASDIPLSKEYIDKNYPDIVEFHFDKIKKGYGWVFPKDGYVSVGIGGIDAAKSSDSLKSYYEFINNLGFGYIKPSGHFLPVGGVERKTYNNRVLLTGDAAGFVDAFLGEGIYYAIMSGRLAAETVVDAFYKNDFSKAMFSEYQDKCKHEFGDDLKYSYIVSKVFYRHPDIFAKMLATNEKMLYRFIHLVTGNSDYSSFIKWLLPRIPYYTAKNFIPL